MVQLSNAFISLTAWSRPTRTARAMMLWPMLYLDDFRNVSQPRHVAIVQAVPGIDAHSEFVGELRGLRNGFYFRVGFFRAPGIRIPAGMELDEIG